MNKKFIDLTGQVFGRLTVIQQVGRHKSNRGVLWLCHCSCGKEFRTTCSNLRSGNTKSCGCLIHDRSKTFIDLTGQIFGRLIVLKCSGYARKGVVLWLCRCSCGKKKIIRGFSLRYGTTKSCGCLNKEIITRRGPDHPKWKGLGRKKTTQGYIEIYKPDYLNANKKGYVREHIYVMSQILGRPLTKDETVHHKNGIKNDNKPENLELWVNNHPSGQRVVDLVNWAKELLMKYEPKALK